MSIYARMASIFIRWNLFQIHTLNDGTKNITYENRFRSMPLQLERSY